MCRFKNPQTQSFAEKIYLQKTQFWITFLQLAFRNTQYLICKWLKSVKVIWQLLHVLLCLLILEICTRKVYTVSRLENYVIDFEFYFIREPWVLQMHTISMGKKHISVGLFARPIQQSSFIYLFIYCWNGKLSLLNKSRCVCFDHVHNLASASSPLCRDCRFLQQIER